MPPRHTLRTRFFHFLFRRTRSLTLGVRGMVVNDRNEILLVRHTYVPGWHFPGGGVEKGETAEEALEREVFEEAGIVITRPPELFGIYSNHQSFRNDHVLFYRIRNWEQGEATSVGEIEETGFFPVDSLPEGTGPATLERVREVFLMQDKSRFWSIEVE